MRRPVAIILSFVLTALVIQANAQVVIKPAATGTVTWHLETVIGHFESTYVMPSELLVG